KGYKKLIIGGKMLMVTKRKDWYKNKLTTVFGGVKVIETNGYYVFIAEKRIRKVVDEAKNANQLSKKLKRKYNKA
ncbi:MAG TPA: methyltransferase, partial [Mobilitalea sp.]|nr:methyltransferase [Mobilitalea sp.]